VTGIFHLVVKFGPENRDSSDILESFGKSAAEAE